MAAELDGGWLIHRPADLLTLPEGLKGWLLPLNADDTNVVCGRWRTEITFMQITDRHTGAVAIDFPLFPNNDQSYIDWLDLLVKSLADAFKK